MNERKADENSNERMADRPARDDADFEAAALAIDDTAPETNAPAAVDDV